MVVCAELLAKKDTSMKAKWYYVENDQTVGPTTLEDLSERLKFAGQSHLVWTEGMADWTDAKAVPALSRFFQSTAATFNPGHLPEPPAPKATLGRRLRHELTEYLIISTYLYVCFSSLIFYKASILQSDGIVFATYGFAIVKALILGKFILVLHALKLGEGKLGAGVLLADILKKSVLFVIFLIALTVAEEIIVGYFHGRTSQEVVSEMAGGTLPQAFAVAILMLLILIPYFTFRGIADRLGEGVLWKLLTQRSSSASARAAIASGRGDNG
jgi:hypothetical protein